MTIGLRAVFGATLFGEGEMLAHVGKSLIIMIALALNNEHGCFDGVHW